jgi:SAM-dependent methyltransferase
MVETLVRNRPGIADKLLIAPCGSGADHQYLSPHARTIYGIDLSPLALKNCPASMEVKAGDILESGYPDGMFDVVASPLFFHHVEKIGFDPYLKEFFRVLKERGSIIILEPSLWYPLNILRRRSAPGSC